MAESKVKMTETYTPETDRRGLTRYAGSEYTLPEDVAAEIVNDGYGEYMADTEVTDAAKRLAEDLGVDLSQVEGSGSGGRIIEKDVRAAAREAGQQSQQQPPPGEPESAGPPEKPEE